MSTPLRYWFRTNLSLADAAIYAEKNGNRRSSTCVDDLAGIEFMQDIEESKEAIAAVVHGVATTTIPRVSDRIVMMTGADLREAQFTVIRVYHTLSYQPCSVQPADADGPIRVHQDMAYLGTTHIILAGPDQSLVPFGAELVTVCGKIWIPF